MRTSKSMLYIIIRGDALERADLASRTTDAERDMALAILEEQLEQLPPVGSTIASPMFGDFTVTDEHAASARQLLDNAICAWRQQLADIRACH